MLAPVIVVVGDDFDELLSACTWHDELVAQNRAPEEGMAGSVRIGVRALQGRATVRRAVVLLADQPLLSLRQLSVIRAAKGQIVVPRYDGRPGNPVVLDRSVWPLAAALEGDRGFSQIFGALPNLVTYVDVPGSNPDIDTRAQLDEISRGGG
jgi:CTP:molybdopterin cytidylyltransferase MocA